MKKKNHYYLLCIVASLLYTACNTGIEKTESKLSSEDSMKIAFYDKYFSEGESLIEKSIFNKPVKTKLADTSIFNFKELRKSKDTNTLKKLLKTEYVKFNFKELTDWMKNDLNGITIEEMRIFLGAYNEAFLNGEPTANRKGKDQITVFLWPYNNNAPARKEIKDKNGILRDSLVQPFNLGSLHP